MEYVEHQICKDDRELCRFYRNAGRLSAVLHLLGCSDCHHENLIACKDQLLLVDAETLFEGTPTETVNAIDSSAFGLSKLQREIAVSVLKLGILPHWEVVGVDQMPIDASALGIQPPPNEHRQVAGWVGLNSDGMFSGQRYAAGSSSNVSSRGLWESEQAERVRRRFLRWIAEPACEDSGREVEMDWRAWRSGKIQVSYAKICAPSHMALLQPAAATD
jgi:hypothetical protein